MTTAHQGRNSSPPSSTSTGSAWRGGPRSKFKYEYMSPQEYPAIYDVIPSYTPDEKVVAANLNVTTPPNYLTIFCEQPEYIELYLRNFPWYRQVGRNYYPEFHFADMNEAFNYDNSVQNSRAQNSSGIVFYTNSGRGIQIPGYPINGHLINRFLNKLRNAFMIGYSFYGFNADKMLFYFIKNENIQIPCPSPALPKKSFSLSGLFKKAEAPPPPPVCTFPKIIEVEPLDYSSYAGVKQINEVISFTQKKMIQTGFYTDDVFDYGYVISNVELNRDEAVRDSLMKSLTPNTNDNEIYKRGNCKLKTLNLTILKKEKGITKEFDDYFINKYFLTSDESKAFDETLLNNLKKLFTPSLPAEVEPPGPVEQLTPPEEQLPQQGPVGGYRRLKIRKQTKKLPYKKKQKRFIRQKKSNKKNKNLKTR